MEDKSRKPKPSSAKRKSSDDLLPSDFVTCKIGQGGASEVLLATRQYEQLMKSKKTKIYEENRKFKDTWTDEFFCVPHQGKHSLCLICFKTISTLKRCNLERHFRTLHPEYNVQFPYGSEIRCQKIRALSAKFKEKLIHENSFVVDKLTEAAYEIAWILAKHNKPFKDAEMIKECFLSTVDNMYGSLNEKDAILNQIKSLQLSENTIMEMTVDIGNDIRDQLIADLSFAPFFSIALDEVTDMCNAKQLLVWVRYPKEDSILEELLCLLPLNGLTGEDLLSPLLGFFSDNNLNWAKVVSVCTNGSTNMIDEKSGLVGLLRDRGEISRVAPFSSIIHNDSLIGKLNSWEFQNVIRLVVQVINFIISNGSAPSQFSDLLLKYESDYGDQMHHKVKLFNKGKVLELFLDLLPQIREFTGKAGRYEPDLYNPEWIMKLAFLTDLICHLNMLSLKLKERDKNPAAMLSMINAFQNKISSLFIPDRQFVHFPNLKNMTQYNPEMMHYFSYDSFENALKGLEEAFTVQFKDILKYKEFFAFIDSPFNVHISALSPALSELWPDRAAVESEIVELQSNEILKALSKSNEEDYWRFVPDIDYPTLKKTVRKVMCFFMSTYLIENTLSTMNEVMRNQGSRANNAHLDTLLRIAVTNYKFNKEIVKERGSQFAVKEEEELFGISQLKNIS